MKLRYCGRIPQALALLTLFSVALAFQATNIHPRRGRCWITTTATWAADNAQLSARRSRLDSEHSKDCVGRSYRTSDGGGRARGRASELAMARASTLRAEQKQRVKEATVKYVSPKAQREAKRARKAYFRDKFASSSYRLIKLQKEDPDSYYIGFVGANRAGRGDALKAVEAFLKRATELKVGYYYKDVSIKLVDAGSLRVSEMAGKDNRKLGLLRRCDLLVHVVRCFDLQKPKAADRSDAKDEGGGEGNDDLDGIDWPLSATPLEDVKSTIEDMAYADLQFIQERHRTNHTKWFWRDKGRAYNEQKAVRLIEPELEETYSVGGMLKPKGMDFAQSCLQDEVSRNGTMISKGPMRFAIKEIGFLTPKPVVYVANLPEETVLPGESEVAEESRANVEVAESIARVAYAHADKILAIEREYGVPAVAVCLRARDGQDDLGAKVYKAMPRSFLARDPKAKKAAKSASNLRRRIGLGRPGKGRRPNIIGGTKRATASAEGKGEEQGQETAAVGDVSKEAQPQPA